MLKLKKLQILGFKSFCDRTELKFHGEGIAAIIGPNGCGKSNIADAISWVLGEQSSATTILHWPGATRVVATTGDEFAESVDS